MKKLFKKIRTVFGLNHKKFCWFDLQNFHCYEIDNSVTGPDGTPVPPIDCVRAPCGCKVSVYQSKTRGTRHACIAGRAVQWDSVYGLFCSSDFDADNYTFIGTYVAKLQKVKHHHNPSEFKPFKQSWIKPT